MFPPFFAIANKYPESRLKIMSTINNELFKKIEYKFLKLAERDEIVLVIEKSIYEKSIKEEIEDWLDVKFLQTYSRESYRIVDWISKSNLADIRVNYKDIAFKTTRELFPGLYISHEEYIKQRGQQKIETKLSRQYRCSRCGHSETKVHEIQLRSFDEGSNISITCQNCSHHWII